MALPNYLTQDAATYKAAIDAAFNAAFPGGTAAQVARIGSAETISGIYTFTANPTIQKATFPTLTIDLYSSATATDRGQLLFRRTRNAAAGSHTATNDGDYLLSITGQGNSGAAFTSAASIFVIQRGAAGTFTPGDIGFDTSDGGSAPSRRVTITKGGNLSIASTVLAPTSAAFAAIFGNSGAALGAATADMVSVAAVDDGAGNCALQIQGEVAKYIIGNKGSRTIRVGGQDAISYVSGTGTAGADNTAQTVKSITLGADSLAKVGDRVRVRALIAPSASTVTVTLQINGGTYYSGGHSAVVLIDLVFSYVDNTHGNKSGLISENSVAPASATHQGNMTGFSFSSSQTIAILQDAVVGAHLNVLELTVEPLS